LVKGIRMPSAAPGVIARGAMRQPGPRCSWVPVPHSNRTGAGCSSGLGSGSAHQPGVRRYRSYLCFTQLLSVIGVERGRLGEVESLVGDCRPPPPGNPHRPPARSSTRSVGMSKRNLQNTKLWFVVSSSKGHKCGGLLLLINKLHSYIKYHPFENLKELNYSQYFKINHSFFPCAEIRSVLEFGRFHSHLYGVWLRKPPPIAITNVLKK